MSERRNEKTTQPKKQRTSFFQKLLTNKADATAPLDSHTSVKTPENIAFNYRIAGPHRRMLAFFLDAIIISTAIILFSVFGGFMIGILGMLIGPYIETIANLFGAVWFLLCFAVWWFYGAYTEAYMNGQTLAKRILGLRVVTVDGRPINGIQAAARNILRYADLYPFFTLDILNNWIWFDSQFPVPLPVPTLLVGLVCMTITKRHQRMGDLVCGTMVVFEEPRWVADIAMVDDLRTPELAEYIPPEFVVSRNLAKALAHYVDRRRFFNPIRRGEIARHLAEPLLEQFSMRADTSHDLILCALYYRTFIAKKEEENSRTAAPNVQLVN